MSLKIYSYPNNFKVAKAQIAAAFAGFEIETPNHKFPEDNHTAEFKKLNPLGKVPVLETANGALFESNAILRYVARYRGDNNLLGAGFWEQALVDQWLDFTANELEAARAVWLLPIYKVLAYDEDAYVQAKKDVEKALKVVNDHLLRRTFMVGNAITIADISLAAALHGMYATVFDAAFRGQFPNVQRWFETVANQDEFKKVMGAVAFAAAERKAEGAGAAAGHKKAGADAGKDKKSDKPKGGDAKDKAAKPADAKPKADAKDGAKGKADKKGGDKPKNEKSEKPKEAAAPAKSNLDLMDELEKPAKKAKNPLDDLPESPMILDATKKLFFSQKPFNPNFWSEFWPKYDAAGYSMYTIKYKYDAENTVYFKSCNAIGGFIQRSDDCRKYAFGVVNMVGTDEDTPPFKINGAWIFRGPEMIREMKAVDDHEYFEWTKVDTSKPAGKAAIEKAFTGDVPSDVTSDKLLERRFFK